MNSTARLGTLRTSAIAGALSGIAALTVAATDAPAVDCHGGVCMANIDAAQAVEPCRNANLVAAWSQVNGAMAIACWTSDAPMDQPLYLFDRRHPAAPAWALTGIRAFTSETLPQLAHVPGDGNDALLPACRKPDPPTMAPGELLLTEKVPSDNERHPYCYRVLRVSGGAAGLAIRADDGRPPKAGTPDPDWRELAGRMTALAARADAQSRARVTRARAPLRDKPEPKSAPHGWLVSGDAVLVLDRNGPGGLVQVLYMPVKGAAIVRWMGKDDLTP